MRTFQILLLCTLIGSALPGSASAQTPGATGKGAPPKPPVLAAAPAEAVTAKARDLYAEGVKAFREQRLPEAYAAFVGAWALNKHYTIAGNLGAVEVELGKHRDAAEHLAIYMRELLEDEKSTKEEREAGARTFERARGKVLALKISVDARGADVRVDGQLAGASPLLDPIFVEPGKHSLEVRAADHVTDRREVEGTAGELKEVTITLAKIPVAPAPTATTSATVPAPRSKVPAYVIGGLAVAGLAVGAGLVAGSRAEYDSATVLGDQIREAGGTCKPGAVGFDARCADVESAANSSNALKIGGGVAFAVAGVAAGGAVLYLLWPNAKPAQSGVRAVPIIAESAGGIAISGGF